MTNTRIVATVGPATCNEQSLLKLKEAGVNVIRLNGSHNALEWHSEVINLVHKVLPGTPILLDIPGRKIRTIQLRVEPTFLAGDILILTTDISHDGAVKVPVNYANLHLDLKVGHTVLADDGTLRFTVVGVEARDIILRAETPGCLKSRKGINVPFVKLNTQLVTQRDKEMIQFAQENKVDFIGLSFVESREHVSAIRELIAPLSYPRIVSKIENQGGLDNMEEIIDCSDAIMIDRGDLSVETDLDSLALMQKNIIKVAQLNSKPVIVATELLHTMIENSFPTKAEVCDITNAILDGAAAVMLSGETAVGKYPVEAVALMRRVANKAEDYLRNNFCPSVLESSLKIRMPAITADAIEILCKNAPITKIVAITRSGYAARTLATRNFQQPIYAVSDDEIAAISFNIFAGVTGIYSVEKFSKNSLDHVVGVLKMLFDQGLISEEDLILVTAVGYPNSGNRMNMIQTHLVSDLKGALAWH